MVSGVRRMEGHIIICGLGRVGRKVAAILKEHNIQFVIIDSNPEIKELVDELGYKLMTGDATSEKMLLSADIDKAKGLVAAMDNDAKNLFVVITARKLNRELFICTRTRDDMVIDKFREAGANFIVNALRSAVDEILGELAKG
jgi:voltage-gated potassium channel